MLLLCGDIAFHTMPETDVASYVRNPVTLLYEISSRKPATQNIEQMKTKVKPQISALHCCMGGFGFRKKKVINFVIFKSGYTQTWP